MNRTLLIAASLVLILCRQEIWSDNAETNTPYATTLMSAERYERLLDAAKVPKEREMFNGQFWLARTAVDFIVALGRETRPDFEVIANQDVNANPLAVLYSEFCLAREGRMNPLSMPRNFRWLQMVLRPLYDDLPDDSDRMLLIKLVLNVYREIQVDSLMTKVDIPEGVYKIGSIEVQSRIIQAGYFSSFWEDIQWFALQGLKYQMNEAKEFCRDFVLLDLEISRLLWDDQLWSELPKYGTDPAYFPKDHRHLWGPIAADMQDAFRESESRYDWLFEDLVRRCKEVGARVALAMMSCADRAEPQRWEDRASSLLLTASQPGRRKDFDEIFNGVTTQEEYEERLHGAIRTADGLKKLGFEVHPGDVIRSEDRDRFCLEWSMESTVTLSQFEYFITTLNILFQGRMGSGL